jgi:hypothetical protein
VPPARALAVLGGSTALRTPKTFRWLMEIKRMWLTRG